MTKINWKPGTMLSPLPPVMVSCGTVDKPNAMTVAWTGIISSDPVMTYVSIRPQRHSHDIIKESGEFVINLPTWNMVTAVDFCGVKSGKDIDKFKETGLTPAACAHVSAPQIEECPVSIECKVKSITNYGVHDMFLAEVVGVSVDDKFIDDKGALDLEKAGILAYAHGKYYTLGRNLGSFGFVKPRRSPFGLRAAKNSDGERRSYGWQGEDRRVRDENRKPFNRDGGERRDFRGDGNRKRNFGANDERRTSRPNNGKRPTGNFNRKSSPKK